MGKSGSKPGVLPYYSLQVYLSEMCHHKQLTFLTEYAVNCPQKDHRWMELFPIGPLCRMYGTNHKLKDTLYLFESQI